MKSDHLGISFDHVQLLHGLVACSLEREHLAAIVSALAPTTLQFGHQIVSLCVVREMISVADSNGDKQIDFEEFVTVITRK